MLTMKGKGCKVANKLDGFLGSLFALLDGQNAIHALAKLDHELFLSGKSRLTFVLYRVGGASQERLVEGSDRAAVTGDAVLSRSESLCNMLQLSFGRWTGRSGRHLERLKIGSPSSSKQRRVAEHK